RIISSRVNRQAIGFSNIEEESIQDDNLLKHITPTDIRSFGLIPELIGRFPVLTYLEPLDEKALKRILTEPKNAIIKQYTRLFEMDGIQLKFDKDSLDYIVHKAVEYKLGARGLRSICEAILLDAMFQAPGNKEKELFVTLSYVKSAFKKSKLSKLKVA
ncbi:MAG: ATP-dependent Clp protease ATP-binding subunit ClpX, partial [Crocinitomicaceae bacterium]